MHGNELTGIEVVKRVIRDVESGRTIRRGKYSNQCATFAASGSATPRNAAHGIALTSPCQAQAGFFIIVT